MIQRQEHHVRLGAHCGFQARGVGRDRFRQHGAAQAREFSGKGGLHAPLYCIGAGDDQRIAPVVTVSQLRRLPRLAFDLQAQHVQIFRCAAGLLRDVERERRHRHRFAERQRRDGVAGQWPDDDFGPCTDRGAIVAQGIADVLVHRILAHWQHGLALGFGGSQKTVAQRVGMAGKDFGACGQQQGDVRRLSDGGWRCCRFAGQCGGCSV